MDNIKQRIVGVLEGLDEALNAWLGPISNIPQAANPHYTCSQRWGYEILNGTPTQKVKAKAIDALLTWIARYIFGIMPVKSHCLDAIDNFDPNLPWSG